MRNRIASMVAVAGAAVVASAAMAQVSFTGSYSQNFNTIPVNAAAGTANWTPNPLSTATGSAVAGLPGWFYFMNSNPATPPVPRLTDGSGAGGFSGGLYGFGVAGSSQRALGSVGSGTPGTQNIGIILQNGTGSTISSLRVRYTGKQWRAENAPADGFTFWFRAGATAPTARTDWTTNTNWTAFAALNFVAPIVGSATPAAIDPDTNAAARVAYDQTITGLNVPAGEFIALRWTDINDTGNDLGVSIDDVQIDVGAAPPAGNVSIGAITLNNFAFGTVPSNITYTFAGITNIGVANATPTTITAPLPAGVSLVSTTLPGGTGTVSVVGSDLVINLGTLAPAAVIPSFDVVLTAAAEFPETTGLRLAFTPAPSNQAATNTFAAVQSVTGPVLRNDVVFGGNRASAFQTLRLIRGDLSTPPALVNDNWTNLSFAQSVEFDNKDGIIANPAGNLLALNFGSTTTGGSLYAYPTVNRAPRGGVVLGSFIADFPGPVSTASRFFLGAPPYTETSPSLTLSRGQMGGLSVSPNNNLVAYTTSTSADPLSGNVVGILEYSNTGDGTGTISDGFEFSDGGVTLPPNATAGTAWLDNEYLLVAAPFNTLGNERVELSLFRVDASINSISKIDTLSIPAGGSLPIIGNNAFTDVEFNPNATGFSDKIIVSVGSFGGTPQSTRNFVWVLPKPDTTQLPGAIFQPPTASVNVSTPTLNTARELGLRSNGTVLLSTFGGAVAAFPATGDVTTQFVASNIVNYITLPTGTADGFSGLAVASGAAGAQPCNNPADVANTDGDASPDGAIDNGDFTLFFLAFFLDETDPARLLADIANTDGETARQGAGPDGTVDNGDFTAFFTYFFLGCPVPEGF
jgi:uncharacterized repeat protein (TIGR01451 family)